MALFASPLAALMGGALLAAFVTFGISHNDLHSDNIMGVRVQTDTVYHYNVLGRTYVVPLNGWLWMCPSSMTPRYMRARTCSCRARCSGVMSSRSATWPHHSIVALCMLNVRPVAPQCRPTSSLTRM